METRSEAQQSGRAHGLALSIGWFGLNFHWLPISFVLLQAQVTSLVAPAEVPLGIGLAAGCGGVLAVVVPPLVGARSDRLRTPFGRRRPIIVVGLAGNLVGLLLLATAHSYVALVAGYLAIQLCNNAAGAAYAGLIPDLVPAQEVGRASGQLGAMYNLGGILGVGATLLLSATGHLLLTYAVIAPVVVLAFVPVLWAARHESAAGPARPAAFNVRDFLAPLWGGSFSWVLFTRFVMTAGLAVVAFFLSPYFKNVLHVPNASTFTSLWLLVVFLCGVPFGYLGGRFSDRIGRKVFVYAAGAVQTAVSAYVLVLAPSAIPVIIALGAVFGVGYGLYYAVDWALACDTLPDPADAAKDMGLFHIAYTLPQAFIPLVGGALITGLSGAGAAAYQAIFVVAIVCFVLGTVLVRQVRAVR